VEGVWWRAAFYFSGARRVFNIKTGKKVVASGYSKLERTVKKKKKEEEEEKEEEEKGENSLIEFWLIFIFNLCRRRERFTGLASHNANE
jgi:hypothetical protein